MTGLLMISADCHATAEPTQYLDYMEVRYRAEYEETIPSIRHQIQRSEYMYTPEAMSAFKAEANAIDPGALWEAQWDSDCRRRVLEADGVVGEVIFPNGSPFMVTNVQPQGAPTPEQQAAGKRAYNRWLAEFCGELPGRRAGLAQLDLHDIEGAVAEVEWAANAGLKGVMFSAFGFGNHAVYDPRYEPLWAKAEETQMVVHFHGGAATTYDTQDPDLMFLLYATETSYFTRRPLHFLIWSGVLERHPSMKVVITEAKTGWVPDHLELLDSVWRASFNASKRAIPRPPSEYWRRQCFVGASMLTDTEADRREAIGVDKIMFGNDFPHLEGTWPRTREWLQTVIGGAAEDDIRHIVGGNAADVYGFDRDALQAVADEVGPAIEDLSVRQGTLRPGLYSGR